MSFASLSSLPFVVMAQYAGHNGESWVDSRWATLSQAQGRREDLLSMRGDLDVAIVDESAQDDESDALSLCNGCGTMTPESEMTNDLCDECGITCTACGYVDLCDEYELSTDGTRSLFAPFCGNCAYYLDACAHGCGVHLVGGWMFYQNVSRTLRETGALRGYADLYRTSCSDCGDVCYGCSQDLGYCEECDESTCEGHPDCGTRISGLHYYSYTPELVFRAQDDESAGAPTFGLELEVSTNDDEHPEILSAVLGYESHVYCKEDSSVAGFEAVTHPMTYRYWAETFAPALAPALERLARDGAHAEDNGIHVHVGRTAFVSRSHLARFIALVDQNGDALVKVARRRSDEWAAFGMIGRVRSSQESGYTRKGNVLSMLTAEHGSMAGGRYRAVNLTNAHTVEVRMWRGSLDIEHVLGAVAFMAAAVEYTRTLTVQEAMAGALSLESFADWAQYRSEYAPVIADLCDAAETFVTGRVRHTMPA